MAWGSGSRDYGLPGPYEPAGKPVILERLDEACQNAECQCDSTFAIEIPLLMPNYEGGLGVGRYTGCACCCWASPMVVTGKRLHLPDAPERALSMADLARHGLLFSTPTLLWSDQLTKDHGSSTKDKLLVTSLVNRHWSGDWGAVSREQQAANDRYLIEGGGPLISVLQVEGLPLLRLVTNAERTKTEVDLAG